jgi:hypothetical protein
MKHESREDSHKVCGVCGQASVRVPTASLILREYAVRALPPDPEHQNSGPITNLCYTTSHHRLINSKPGSAFSMQITECHLETLCESMVKLADWSESKLPASGITRHTRERLD